MCNGCLVTQQRFDSAGSYWVRSISRVEIVNETPFKQMNKTNWWKDFGLKANPYVYGPMLRLRTSQRYRMEEARRMGWMAWTWQDEYTDERKGSGM